MKRNFLIVLALGFSAWLVSVDTADAFVLRRLRCRFDRRHQHIVIKPYNAFDCMSWGRMHFTGCCPSTVSCGHGWGHGCGMPMQCGVGGCMPGNGAVVVPGNGAAPAANGHSFLYMQPQNQAAYMGAHPYGVTPVQYYGVPQYNPYLAAYQQQIMQMYGYGQAR